MIEIIRPRNRAQWFAARARDITASQVAALFPDEGGHRWTTLRELWAEKTGRDFRPAEENPAQRRGRHLERTAVDILREEHPTWKLHHNHENHYYRDPEARLGATPDVLVTAPDRGKGIIQIKSVDPQDFRTLWHDEDGNVEVPFYIVLQALLEAHLVPGTEWAAVAPIVVARAIDVPLIEIPLDDMAAVAEAMAERGAEFWQMVAENREPPPDFGRDGGLIARMFGMGDPEHAIDLSGDNRMPQLLAERAAALEDLKTARAKLDAVDAEVQHKMGAAHYAFIGRGKKITWKPEKRDGFFVKATTIRAIRYPR